MRIEFEQNWLTLNFSKYIKFDIVFCIAVHQNKHLTYGKYAVILVVHVSFNESLRTAPLCRNM